MSSTILASLELSSISLAAPSGVSPPFLQSFVDEKGVPLHVLVVGELLGLATVDNDLKVRVPVHPAHPLSVHRSSCLVHRKPRQLRLCSSTSWVSSGLLWVKIAPTCRWWASSLHVTIAPQPAKHVVNQQVWSQGIRPDLKSSVYDVLNGTH
ncbi:hypothetical protein C8R47DRAFT_1103634 [Mycena vitilis]|nr:hypothetical protein C8R47DRAFT_1103634 [Mycena vitilis]